MAVAAIIEDITGKRRCGLGHYDPMSLRLEIDKRPTPESVVNLFHNTAQTDRKKLVKKEVIVMSSDPENRDKAFINGIKIEAHYLLGCDNVIVIKYGENFSDRLDIVVPNNNSGSPVFSTSTRRGSLDW